MASEIKVDTISEKTSAGGVTIDGLLIKDGNISGDVALAGTTPTFTIGDAGAEDATLLFDGNAQDFHIGLDDTADDLVIGVGSTLGTTTAIAIDENANTTFSGTVTVGVNDTGKDVKLFGATAGSYWLWDESADGVVQVGTLTVGVDDAGHDVKLFGNAAGAYMEWDASADELRIMGASADATTSTGKLLLATSLTDINANDVIGKIDFQAPHEGGGTDAITVAASIRAIAQGTFSASVNATDLIFYTGHSEAAAEKVRFTSQNEIGIAGANYGTDGQVLTSGGAGAAVAWEDASGAVTALNNATQSELVTVGSTTTELDAEANLTFTGSALTCIGTITTGVDNTGHDVKFFGATSGSYALWDESADSLSLIASTLGVVTAKDLGTGIHVRTSDSGADVSTNADELVVENSATCGISILSGNSQNGVIHFGDDGDNDIGNIDYDHSDNSMRFTTNTSEAMRIASDGGIAMGSTSSVGGLHVTHTAGNSTSKGVITITSNESGAGTAILFGDDTTVSCGRITVLGSSDEISIIGQTSDYRLKQDIDDMDSSWETIKSLKPRKYKLKKNLGIGYQNSFIAHELDEIVPKAVAGEKDAVKRVTNAVINSIGDLVAEDVTEEKWEEGKGDGTYPSDSTWSAETDVNDYQGIDVTKLIPDLTNALKESLIRIETLEAKVAVLEG